MQTGFVATERFVQRKIIPEKEKTTASRAILVARHHRPITPRFDRSYIFQTHFREKSSCELG